MKMHQKSEATLQRVRRTIEKPVKGRFFYKYQSKFS